MSVLYICYQSLLDPLTQTQVVAYLKGLASQSRPIILLTFEPTEPNPADEVVWHERLSQHGIIWKQLRYHKRPTLLATLWDVAVGIVFGWKIIRDHGVGLVHARSHVPALMGRVLKRLTGVKLLFDIRGFLAEEYVDAGVWPTGSRLFLLTKRVERQLVNAADAIVVLANQAKHQLEIWYPDEIRGKSITVIPCCTDLDDCLTTFPSARDEDDNTRRLVYAGKLGGSYLTDEMVEFVAVASQMVPNLKWQVWSQSDHRIVREPVEKNGLTDRVAIGQTTPHELTVHLQRCDAGLAFKRPDLSRQAASPTKVGEYLAAGLPVVSFSGVGDLDEHLSGRYSNDGQPVGVIIREPSHESYKQACDELVELWRDPSLPDRCRAVAKQLFDLRTVGWKRYRTVYEELLDPFPSTLHQNNRSSDGHDVNNSAGPVSDSDRTVLSTTSVIT